MQVISQWIKKNIFFLLLTQPVLANTTPDLNELIWSGSNSFLGAVQLLPVQITGGSGAIKETTVFGFSDTSCGVSVGGTSTTGNTFNYTSGNTYNANLRTMTAAIVALSANSIRLRVTDSADSQAAILHSGGFESCIEVSCSDADNCNFTPSNGYTLTLP